LIAAVCWTISSKDKKRKPGRATTPAPGVLVNRQGLPGIRRRIQPGDKMADVIATRVWSPIMLVEHYAARCHRHPDVVQPVGRTFA